jgi:hypothetical protein
MEYIALAQKNERGKTDEAGLGARRRTLPFDKRQKGWGSAEDVTSKGGAMNHEAG